MSTRGHQGLMMASTGGGGGGIEIVDITHSVNSGGGSSYAVGLPPSLAVGDLVMVVIQVRPNKTITAPSGWVLQRSDYDSAGSAEQTSIYTRIVDGSEGSTASFTASGSFFAVFTVIHISGSAGSSFFSSAYSTIYGVTTKTPPPLTPAWGSAESLWIVVAGTNLAVTTTQYPLPDNNNTFANGGTIEPRRTMFSSTVETAATITPDDLKWSGGSAYGQIYTIAIKPA